MKRRRKKPTAAEERYQERVKLLGCVACWKDGYSYENASPADFHHYREYGVTDHMKGFGLCDKHHRDTNKVPGVVCRHGNQAQFEERYGTDKELFEMCLTLLGEQYETEKIGA